MLPAFRLEVTEVVLGNPSLGKEQITQPPCVANDFGTFSRPHVEPDPKGQLGGQRLHFAEEDAVVPPHRGGKDREAIEYSRILETQMEREQPAQR